MQKHESEYSREFKYPKESTTGHIQTYSEPEDKFLCRPTYR